MLASVNAATSSVASRLIFGSFFLLASTPWSMETCQFSLPAPAILEDMLPGSSALADEWKGFLDQLYPSGTRADSEVPTEERIPLDVNDSSARSCSPSTFGELPSEHIFGSSEFALSASDSLVDLGSGLGQQVISGVLFSNASRGLGIELSKSRFVQSCAALDRLGSVLQSGACRERCRSRSAKSGRIEMRHANLLDIDLSGFTAVLMYSTCFPMSVMSELQQKLLRELPLGARVLTTATIGWSSRLELAGRKLVSMPYPVRGSEGVPFMLYRVEVTSAAEAATGTPSDPLRESERSEEL
jgi:hypothetical protein